MMDRNMELVPGSWSLVKERMSISSAIITKYYSSPKTIFVIVDF